jgi:hypothetical protein
MTTPTRKVTIQAGTDWQDVVSIFQSPYVYHSISAVTRGWPTAITVTGHGLPADVIGMGWIRGSGKLGLDTEPAKPLPIRRIDADTLELIGYDTIGKAAYTGGAKLSTLTSLSLTGAEVRTQFKTAIDGDALVTLTQDAGITVASRTITIALTDAQTRLLIGTSTTPVSGIAQVELTLGGVTSQPFQYGWTVHPEWTKES